MEGLAVAIQQRRVRFPEGPIVAELEALEYAFSRTGVQYMAPEGLHDDCVCAVALAVHHSPTCWSTALHSDSSTRPIRRRYRPRAATRSSAT